MKFDFLNKDSTFELPIGQHVLFRAQDQTGAWVSRVMTPLTKLHQKSHFEIIVKRYEKGAFSTYLTDMKPGDYVSCRTCFGRVTLL